MKVLIGQMFDFYIPFFSLEKKQPTYMMFGSIPAKKYIFINIINMFGLNEYFYYIVFGVNLKFKIICCLAKYTLLS